MTLYILLPRSCTHNLYYHIDILLNAMHVVLCLQYYACGLVTFQSAMLCRLQTSTHHQIEGLALARQSMFYNLLPVEIMLQLR